MAQYVYLLANQSFKTFNDSFSSSVFANKIFYNENLELTEEILREMSSHCLTEYFYVVKAYQDLVFNFSFDFKPDPWDSHYVHYWNDDTLVRLFNKKQVLDNPENFSDKQLSEGKIRLKNMSDKIYSISTPDIIFLSYDEFYAKENFDKLKSKFNKVKHVSGIKGIFNAHLEAAKISTTDLFYVVDADAEIVPSFNFQYVPTIYDRDSVHIWHSKNPVNDLEYGYGAVKLFSKDMLLKYKGNPIDFSTSVSKKLKIIPEVSNITRFNTDPFSSWRSAFRECTKLSSKIIKNQKDIETEQRLDIWCTHGADREFGDFVILGANQGREFGRNYADQPQMLNLINDFDWLEKKFCS